MGAAPRSECAPFVLRGDHERKRVAAIDQIAVSCPLCMSSPQRHWFCRERVFDHTMDRSNNCLMTPNQSIYSKFMKLCLIRDGSISESMAMSLGTKTTGHWLRDCQHDKVSVGSPIILNQFMALILRLNAKRNESQTFEAVHHCFKLMISLNIEPNDFTLKLLRNTKLTDSDCIEFIESAKSIKTAKFIMNAIIYRLLSPQSILEFDGKNGHRISSHFVMKLGGTMPVPPTINIGAFNLSEDDQQSLCAQYRSWSMHRRSGNEWLVLQSFRENVLESEAVLHQNKVIVPVLYCCCTLKEVEFAEKVWHFVLDRRRCLVEPNQRLYSLVLRVCQSADKQNTATLRLTNNVLNRWIYAFQCDQDALRHGFQ